MRAPAIKIRIKDVMGGSFSRGDSKWEPSYVTTPREEKLARVRILGTVVARYVSENQEYGAITLDDSTDTIGVRVFKDEVSLIRDIKPGDIVDVVGRPKEYRDERYISCESVWKIDNPNWEFLRRLELLSSDLRSGRVDEVPEETVEKEGSEVVEEEVLGEDKKVVVLGLIEELDEGEGTKYATLIEKSGLEKKVLEDVLGELMDEGEVYEPKIGRFKRI